MASPGIGRQHLPYWMATSFDTAQLQRVGLARLRRRFLAGAVRRPGERLRDDKEQPPAQADVGEDVDPALAPYSRVNASQRSQVTASGGTFSDASACSRRTLASAADSRCCNPLRK